MSLKDTARMVPGVAAAEGTIIGALADEADLPIADYDKQSAGDIAAKLKGLSQRELRMSDAYERGHKNRTGVIDAAQKRIDRG